MIVFQKKNIDGHISEHLSQAEMSESSKPGISCEL